MITRVTTQMTMAAAQSRLQAGAAKVADLTDQATSLKAIRKPSDDPTGTATAMQVRKEQAQAAQHARNADDAVGWLATTDSALAGVSKVLGKVRDLTVQAASDGTMGTTDRQAFISELQGLKADLLSSANTKYGTRSVFAGSSPRRGRVRAGHDVGRLPVRQRLPDGRHRRRGPRRHRRQRRVRDRRRVGLRTPRRHRRRPAGRDEREPPD
ncbi:hypothetical protein [Curtobacterium sp. MCJR17_043]|uniref:flagellin N-terminal helical domain-containing protein n=1 Tax=Curtobacterium sp. MCJR17_043 TaxID=2175660 RepID=UPI0024DFDCD6|nr:hypothetical protein [Curtobacterium sp. MCJR17_043]WIB34908.1 hypothetical protein DEJ15_10195 [Curtobacterium sp. MCJR17_043]